MATHIFCETLITSRYTGLINGADPTKYPSQLLLLQITIVSSFTIIFQFLLKRFGKYSFIPHLLGGIAIGPSCMGRYKKFGAKFFYPKSLVVLDVYESLAFMFLMFLTSVRMDISMPKRAGKISLVIGVATFLVPFMITTYAAFFLRETSNLNQALSDSLPIVASLESTTSFHVVFGILSDLKILNSELGRLALSSSMVSNFLSWIFLLAVTSMKEALETGEVHVIILTQASKVFVIMIIVYVFRPIMKWMMRRTPEGKPLRESDVIGVTLIVLLGALIGEFTGQHFLFGSLVLGLATPDRPPLGSSLTEKIECFIWAVYMPCYIISIGSRVNIFLVKNVDIIVVEFIILIAVFGKLTAVFIASLYYKMPFLDALLLGLLLNTQGFFDIQNFKQAMLVKMLTEEGFTIMVIAAVVHSAILTLLIKIFYNPSRRYVAYQRRTIQHHRRHGELRVVACFHGEDDLSSIVCLLEASNPCKESPIAIYALNMEELVGRAYPALIQHKFGKHSAIMRGRVDRIINVFSMYEHQNHGLVSIECFTAIAPYTTMHDDVCSLAVDKCATLVIVPLQKWDSSLIRAVNKKVLANAPCSVGVLFDRGTLDYKSVVMRRLTLKVWVIFIGGPDDREALAYGSRMADHPNVRLTVLRLVNTKRKLSSTDLLEKKLDINAINDFRIRCVSNKSVGYREESAEEASDTTQLLWSIEDDIDLVIVGIKHETNLPMLVGMSDWSEIEELGVIGDLLASPDCKMKASVLAMQQQALVVEEMVENQSATKLAAQYDAFDSSNHSKEGSWRD